MTLSSLTEASFEQFAGFFIVRRLGEDCGSQVQSRTHQERRRARARTARQPAQSHGGKDDVAPLGQRLKRPHVTVLFVLTRRTATQGARMSTSHVPPSEELLGEAARRVGEAYPGLYAHQRTGVSFLLARRRAILADDMGLGKTRQAIVAAREAAPKGPFLVDLPRRGEAELAARDRPRRGRIRRAGAAREGRVRARRSGGRSSTTTSSARFEDRFARVEWGGVIVDEAHFIKNGSRRAAQVLGSSARRRMRIRRPCTCSRARR